MERKKRLGSASLNTDAKEHSSLIFVICKIRTHNIAFNRPFLKRFKIDIFPFDGLSVIGTSLSSSLAHCRL